LVKKCAQQNALPRVFDSCVALHNGNEASECYGQHLLQMLCVKRAICFPQC
jgi:hypothetical protein